MAIDVKQAHRRLLLEVFNKRNFDVFDELCDPSYRSFDPMTGECSLAQEKENCRGYVKAFPDLQMTIVASHAEGDTVTTQWRCEGTQQGPLMGIPPTGKRATVHGISIATFRGGKIAKDSVIWDAAGVLMQLGVLRLEDLARSAGRQSEARATT